MWSSFFPLCVAVAMMVIFRRDAWNVVPERPPRRSFFKQAHANDSDNEAKTQKEAAMKKIAAEAEARRIAAETKQRLAAGGIGTI